MGIAMAIKEEFARHGISIKSKEMLDLTETYNYGDTLQVLRRNVQIVLHQTAGYFRGLAEKIT